MAKIVIADGLAPEGINRLKQTPGIELIVHSSIDRSDLCALLPGVDILIVRSRTQVDAALLERAGDLRVVVRAGIGLDNIDVAAATERGVLVMNAPTGNIVTTAEHTLALLFCISRHIAQADAELRRGKWEKKKFEGRELRGKTLGLVGLGNIGKVVAQRALGLKMKVVAHDPYLSEEAAAKYDIRLISFDELLSTSDYVSLHVPLTSATRHLFGKETLAKMKRGSYLINCARGGIVDENALIESLDSGLLRGAALDVFETEPLPANHPLLKRSDVVLTPHLGASTEEAQVQVSLEVADQLTQYLQNGVIKNSINVPNIDKDQLNVLKPYLDLCERLGSFAAQLCRQAPVRGIQIRYEGAVADYKRDVLTLSLLKGLLGALFSTSVNLVNVRTLLRERGIRVEESLTRECSDYASLIVLTLEGDEKLTCAGTIFGKGEPRIVRVDDFAIDAVPDGNLLFTKNVDEPGVVGAMGSILGGHGVNIARMHLGRDKDHDRAISIISIDSSLPAEVVDRLRATKGMLSVQAIRL